MSELDFRIKICGLRTEADIDAAIDAGCDAIGLVLTISPRTVTPTVASRLIQHVNGRVLCLAVVRPSDGFRVNDVLPLGFDGLQMRDHPHQDGLVPVFDLNDEGLLEPGPLSILDPSDGSGQLPDPNTARMIVARSPRKLILAGGLDPNNVTELVTLIRPYGVDVSSGVETAPGVKSPLLIQRFVNAAKLALDGVHRDQHP